MRQVVLQRWVQFGPDGAIRPFGYSLHLNQAECDGYIRHKLADKTADWFKPCNEPELVHVSDRIYSWVASNCSVRELKEPEIIKVLREY